MLPKYQCTSCKDVAVLEEHEDDPVVEELTSFINSLSEEEQIDLVALAWLRRNDYSASDWAAVCEEAARAHNERTAEYLLGTPLVGDFLEEGLRCSAIPARITRSSDFSRPIGWLRDAVQDARGEGS
jgi:hypothetical protein